jgi:6-phosphogluconolactonase
MSIQYHEFESVDALRAAARALLSHAFGVESNRPFAIMLSGGGTPLPVYDSFAREPVPVSDQLHITFTDERHVAADTPESNLGNARPMLDALRLAPGQLLLPDTTQPLAECAAGWEQGFNAFFARGGALRLALLGLGDDTHTCSLFDEAGLSASQGRLVIPVERPTPPHRVSVTPGLLERAERIIFLVSGAGKAAVVKQLREQPETTIAGRAVAGCQRVELWYAQ